MPTNKEQKFFVGDVVEAVKFTVLLPLGLQTKIVSSTSDLYYIEEGYSEDGFGYEVSFLDFRGESWTLDYPDSYFKLIERA